MSLLPCLAFLLLGTSVTIGLQLDEEKLVEKLFGGYDTGVRPTLAYNDPTIITVQFYLSNIDDLDAKRQYLHTVGYLGLSWSDPRLVWNASEHNGVKKIVVAPTKIWIPELSLNNAIGDIYKDIPLKYIRAKVTSDGEVSWEPGGAYTSSCRIDIRYFPFDDQVCELQFGNWAYIGTDVNLTLEANKIDVADMVPHVEWVLVDTLAWREDMYFSCCPEPYPTIHFRLHLHRKPLYFIMNIVLPSIMLSMLVLLVFLLPTESGEKISLGVTILLAFAVFILMIAESVPRTSDAVPIIVIYLMFFMGISTLGLCLSVMVLYFYHKRGGIPPPPWLRSLVGTCLSRMVRCRTIKYKQDSSLEGIANGAYNEGTKPGNNIENSTNEKQSDQIKYLVQEIIEIKKKFKQAERAEEIAEQWKQISRVLDRFFFAVFTCLLLVISTIILGFLPLTKAPVDLAGELIV